MGSLKVTVTGNKASLVGILDENSDLKSIRNLKGSVIVNFKGVSRVNSCGIKEWVNLISGLKGVSLTYEECPIVVVKQLNSVPDFHGKAKIVSFMAPYYCESCEKEDIALIQARELKGTAPPSLSCKTCKSAMNFDAIPAQYFDFLVRKKSAA